MAMLYMVLFATMALGFYSTVTTAVALAKNDQKSSRAMLAAESGIQFMRYHLAHVTIPPLVTESSAVMEELFNDLTARLKDTGNLANGAYTVGLSDDKTQISIPVEAGAYITTDSTDNSGFAIIIKEQAGNIICKVLGRTGTGSYSTAKGVSLDFTRRELETNLFDNAVASRGYVKMVKGTLSGVGGISPNTIANIMSAADTSGGTPITMSGGTVGGTLGVVYGSAEEITSPVPFTSVMATVTGGSVSGTSNMTTIWNKYIVDVVPPEFPIIDTTAYAPYATNPYVAGETVYKNVRIPAGTNPQFAGGTAVQGIMYVETPNVLQFLGDTTLQGFIVWDNDGDSTINKINVLGNFTHSKLPDTGEWGELATITGVAIMAPNTSLTMSGSTESQIQGNVIVGRFENAGANTITFDQGSLVTMDPGMSLIIDTAKSIRWTSTGFFNQPSLGARYSSYYDPVPGTYQELNQ